MDNKAKPKIQEGKRKNHGSKSLNDAIKCIKWCSENLNFAPSFIAYKDGEFKAWYGNAQTIRGEVITTKQPL